MKETAKKIIILFVAATVFFTGMGVTIMEYCCSWCSEHSDFLSKSHSCCSIHGKENISFFDQCSNSSEDPSFIHLPSSVDNDPHCKASRLSIDIDAFIFKPILSSIFVWVNENTILKHNTPSFSVDNRQEWGRLGPPILYSPRAYLSFIRILII